MSGELVRIRRDFNGHEVTLIERDGGDLCMTSEEIGRALGYPEGSERKRVLGLADRHPEVQPFRVVLKMRTTGGTKEVVCFREPALYMLACFAETPAAVQFRAWVAETCVDLRTRDKVLVDRDEWDKRQDLAIQLLHAYEQQSEAMRRVASAAGMILSLRRQSKPKTDPRQLVFETDDGVRFEEIDTKAGADETEAA